MCDIYYISETFDASENLWIIENFAGLNLTRKSESIAHAVGTAPG